MPLIVWLGSAAIACALPIGWWALSSDRQVSERVNKNLSEYQPTMRAAALERSAGERFVGPLARQTGHALLRFTPGGWYKARTTGIAKAGLTGRVTPEQILGAKVLVPILLGGLLALRVSSETTGTSYLVGISIIVVAFFAPDLLIRSRADRRADEITRVLPDVLDQLTISVEAGLGFEAALARISQTETHALAEEFGRLLQDVQLGTSRGAALDTLATRSQVDDLKTVVLSLRQAEALGVPLAKTLRTLALEMREKRRFRAEERAHQLPIKMIFPLGLCILPALFIVILGPAVVSFFEIF